MKRSGLRPLSEVPAPSSRPEAELAGTLHEVSNALTVVLGWLDVARERAGDSAVREALELARAYARLGHGVARRAIGADGATADAEQAAVTLAREVVLGVTPQAERGGVEVRLDTELGPEDVVGNASVAAQILINLLLNALAFSPGGSTVWLRVREVDTGFAFQVEDQGPGVDPDRAVTLLTAGQSTRPGGAGVGLRHSARLAEVCGGRLALARPGPGACFELLLPRGEVRSGARNPLLPHASLDGACVLVLEDDPNVIGLIELGLEARGARTVCVSSLAELERLVSAERFAAALLDFSPIAEDPAGALVTVRRVAGAVPVVLISGSAAGSPELLQADVKAWVRKPFEMGEVIDVLRSLIAASAG